MIFSSLFRRTPSLQHRDAGVRLKALRTLADDDPRLLSLASDDADTAVRRAAIERLNDPLILLERLRQERDAMLREVLGLRLRAVLAGRVEPALTLEQRIALLAESALPAEVMVYLASEARESALRLVALRRVDDDARLLTIALNDQVAEVRVSAAERIADAEILETLARSSRGRDKRVHRLSSTRLEALRAAAAARAHAGALCAELEALQQADSVDAQAAARVAALDLEWTQAADATLQERWSQARALIEPPLVEYRERAGAIARLAREAEALQARCQALEPLDDASTLSAELQRILAALDTLQASETRTRDLLADVHGSLQHQQHEHEAYTARERLLAACEADDGGSAEAYAERWRQLTPPQDARLQARQEQRFAACLAAARARASRPAHPHTPASRPPVQAGGALDTLLQDIDAALEAGELQLAETRVHEAQALLREQPQRRAEQRLRMAVARLGELRDWARWGSRQAREQLCEEADTLAQTELAADQQANERARQVKSLRERWRQLDAAGAAPRAVWERFDAACERAYAPARTAFAAAAEQRKTHLAERQALLAELSALDSATDWQAADWKQLESHYRELLARWRAAGAVAREDYLALDAAWRSAQQVIGRRLDGERERERSRRQALIDQLQQLADGDLGTAITAAREAQAAWTPSLRLRRREEQALWEALRESCDRIFQRREAGRRVAREQRAETTAAALAVCEALEALAAQPPVSTAAAGQLRAEAESLAVRFAELDGLPHDARTALTQRFEAAQADVESQIDLAQRRTCRQAVHALAEKAALCARLEQMALEAAPDVAEIAGVGEEWQALDALPAELEQRIGARYRAAQQILEGGSIDGLMARLAQGNAARRQLCIELEILAGIEPPAEDAEAHLSRKVERLSATMNGEPLADAESVIRDWYCTAATADPALDARFAIALVALGQA